MKILSSLICLMMVTGIVACNKKKGGGNNPQNPYVGNNYHGPQQSYNDLYVGPGPQQPNIPGTIPQLPGCSTPPQIFNDQFQECAWLATTTDCNVQAVNQMFIERCYGMNLERPGCVITAPQIIQACGSSCRSYDDHDDYERPRRVRTYREERTPVRTIRRVIVQRTRRNVPTEHTVTRESVQNLDPLPDNSEPQGVVEEQQQPAPFVTTPAPVQRQEQFDEQQPVAAVPTFDSSRCQWIVRLHTMLKGADQGYSSFSRLYTRKPLSNTTSVSPQVLRIAMSYAGNSANIMVYEGDHSAGSAIGSDVEIEDNRLVIGDSNEIIKKCEAKKISTQFSQDGHFFTRIYSWNGLSDEDGSLDVTTTLNYNGASDEGPKIDIVTSRLVIWKKGVVTSNIRAKFELDPRITSRMGDLKNSLDLSCITNAKGGCRKDAR